MCAGAPVHYEQTVSRCGGVGASAVQGAVQCRTTKGGHVLGTLARSKLFRRVAFHSRNEGLMSARNSGWRGRLAGAAATSGRRGGDSREERRRQPGGAERTSRDTGNRYTCKLLARIETERPRSQSQVAILF